MTTRVSNSKYLAVLDPVPSENLGWYCRVLSERDYASQIALVERFVHLGFSKEETGAGGAKITLDADDRLFSDPLPVGESVKIQDQEALWQIVEDGIIRAEFLAEDLVEGKITDTGTRTVEITGRGTGAVLDWRKVPPYGMPNPTTMQLKWELRAPMSVWAELFNEAQQDGYFPFVSLTFDIFNDSAGEPWGADQDVSVQAGDSLLDLLTRWCEAGGYAWKMLPGFRLQVLKNPGTIRTGEVVFTMYLDQTKHERSLTRRDIANMVYAASGDKGIAFAADMDSQARWHKRAVWVQAGDTSDASGRSAVANSTLGLKKDAAESRSITVDPLGKGRRVFVDYDVSDRVTVEIDGDDPGQSERKIVAIAVDLDADATVPTLELTLQSMMEARAVKQQKALDALGASQTSGAGSPIPVEQAIAATNLEDLKDIDVAGIQNGDVIAWDASAGKWVDVTPNLNFLTDVDTAGVASGKALIYDGASGLWKPGTATISVAWTDVTGKPASFPSDWATLTGKPSTFPPAAHTHPVTDLSDSTTVGRAVVKAVDAAAARTAIGAGTSSLALGTSPTTAKAGDWVPSWTEVTGKPATFEPVVKGADWLSDVDTSTVAPTNGQTLVWNAAAGLWKPGTAAAGATTLDALTDVDTSTVAPTNGQALVFDTASGLWKPGTVASGSSSTDLYKGGFASGTSYAKDAVVAYNGASWMAKVATSATPTVDTASYSQHFQSGVPSAKWSYSDPTQFAITTDLVTGLGGTPPAGETKALQISGGAGTTITATLTLVFSAPGTFTFSDACTTEGTIWDYGQFSVDGADYGAKVGGTAGSGSGQWRTTTVTVASAGTHTFRWRFVHDGGGTGGRDKYLVAGITTTNAAEPQDWQMLGDITPTLDELTDVDTSTVAPTDGQVLQWSASASQWKPASRANVTVSTTAPTAPQNGDVWFDIS